MAVGQNLDNLFAALRAGLSAHSRINYDPIVDPEVADQAYDIADWGGLDSNPDAFVWGPHKWGSKTDKASK